MFSQAKNYVDFSQLRITFTCLVNSKPDSISVKGLAGFATRLRVRVNKKSMTYIQPNRIRKYSKRDSLKDYWEQSQVTSMDGCITQKHRELCSVEELARAQRMKKRR